MNGSFSLKYAPGIRRSPNILSVPACAADGDDPNQPQRQVKMRIKGILDTLMITGGKIL